MAYAILYVFIKRVFCLKTYIVNAVVYAAVQCIYIERSRLCFQVLNDFFCPENIQAFLQHLLQKLMPHFCLFLSIKDMSLINWNVPFMYQKPEHYFFIIILSSLLKVSRLFFSIWLVILYLWEMCAKFKWNSQVVLKLII